MIEELGEHTEFPSSSEQRAWDKINELVKAVNALTSFMNDFQKPK